MRTNTDPSHKSKVPSQTTHNIKENVTNYVSSSIQRPISSGIVASPPSKDVPSRRNQRLYHTLPTNNRSDQLSQSFPSHESGGGLGVSQINNFAASYGGSSNTTSTGSGSLQRKALHQLPQFFSPPTSSQQQRRALVANSPRVTSETSTGSMSDIEIKSIVKRQQDQLQDLKNRQYVLKRKVDSLKALNEQQTGMLLRDNRTKEIKKEHLQIMQRLKELQNIQNELDRTKRNTAKSVSELSIAKAQMVGKRAEISPQVQYMHLLTEKLDLMRVWSQQVQADLSASQAKSFFKNIFHIESAGDRQSLLLSESANILNQQQWLHCVPSNILSQLENMLQERSRMDAKLKQIRLQQQQVSQYQMQTHNASSDSQQPTTNIRNESSNGNTHLDVKNPPPSSYVYSPRTLQAPRPPDSIGKTPSPLPMRHNKAGTLPPLPSTLNNSSSPPLPERRPVPPQLQFLQEFSSSSRGASHKLGSMTSVDNLLNSPVAADLSGQELLIRPMRPPSIVGRNGTHSLPSNASKLWSADKANPPSFTSISTDAVDGSGASGPPVAPRVMRRASLLRYASNSFIRDTYFRGTRREELAKKYKESADALLQAKLMQLRLSSSVNSTSSNDGSVSTTNSGPPMAVEVQSSLEGSFDNSDETANRVPDNVIQGTSSDTLISSFGDDTVDQREEIPVNNYMESLVPEVTINDLPENESIDTVFHDRLQSLELDKQNTLDLEVNISGEDELLMPMESGIQIETLSDGGATSLLVSGAGTDERPHDINTPTGEDKSDIVSITAQLPKLKTAPKGILRPREVPGTGRRIRFLPLTLLLDASLVGDLEMVKQVAIKVNDVSEPNEDGITALHNSICAGYDEISVFLVLQCAANVNAQELDGWTPLHCAAACGSVDMCRLLVEHGAALLLPTLEDGESALEKATNLARENGAFTGGHAACEEYLHYEVLRLWRLDSPTPLYALFDYTPQQEDELALHRNEKLQLVKADVGDDPYWCLVQSLESNQEGLVPKYFVSRYPILLEGAQLDPDSLSLP